MLIRITDDCINCAACAIECPTEAIYEPGENYQVNRIFHSAISNEHFYIVSDMCNECFGLKKIKCIAICPMDVIIKL